MADLMDLLQGQMSSGIIEQLSKQLGGASNQQTQSAVQSAMAMLMGGLTKNASKPEGASALLVALDRDHDGSILDDVAGFLGGNKSPQNTSMMNGAGILKHILGGNQNNAMEQISKSSGLDISKVSGLLATLAPLVMGTLGKAKQQQNLDQASVFDFLKNSSQSYVKKQPQQRGLLNTLLDKDGDGSILDDVAATGFKSILGKLFGR